MRSVRESKFRVAFAIALLLALALFLAIVNFQTCPPFTGFTQLVHPSRCSGSTLTTHLFCALVFSGDHVCLCECAGAAVPFILWKGVGIHGQ